MQHKKQVIIGAIILVLLTTVGVLGYMYKMKMSLENTDLVTVPEQSVVGHLESKLSATSTDFIELSGIKVGMVLPETWGHLVVPQVHPESGFVMNLPKAMPAAGYFAGGETFTFEKTAKFTKMFVDYDYPVTYNNGTSLPEVTLIKIPESFEDDAVEGPGEYFTALEKEAGIDFLSQVWQQKSVDSKAVEQTCWIVTTGKECTNKSIFWWAANIGSVQDRVAVKYLESANSQWRGVGFFSIVGQDIPYGFDHYTVVLMNPEKHVALEMTFPLGGEEFVTRTEAEKGISDIELTDRISKEYRYISNEENYKNAPLGELMLNIESLVNSMQIVDTDSSLVVTHDRKNNQLAHNDGGTESRWKKIR